MKQTKSKKCQNIETIVFGKLFVYILIMGFPSVSTSFIIQFSNASAEEATVVLKDSALLAKLQTAQNETKAIMNKCSNEHTLDGINNCLCGFIPELVSANQIMTDAWLNLLKRRPELKNQYVRIEGMPGLKVKLDPSALRMMSDPDTYRKLYRCN